MASPSIRYTAPGAEGSAPAPAPAAPKRRYEIDTRVFTVFFLVAIPFVAFGALVVINMARNALQNAMGENLEQRALETKQFVERYVADEFVHLRQLAADPQVRTALSAPPKGKPEDTKKLDQGWHGSDPAVVSAILGSPLSARLRQIADLHPGYRLLQVADANGRLVGSTGRGGHFLNEETAWFSALNRESLDGPGYVGDIYRPANSVAPLLEIAFPVRDDATGRVMGGIRVLLDAYDLYNSVFAPVRVGRTGHAVLLRSSDGLILASDENQRVLKERFDGFAYIQAASRERRGYWITPDIKGQKAKEGEARPAEGAPAEAAAAPIERRRVVGYTPVDRVPNVDWTVVVEQDLSEAVAPIQGITWYLWVHFIGVFGAAILLAFYFSFKLDTPVIDEEYHLHEAHVAPSSIKQAS